jgi:hypothetical protein
VYDLLIGGRATVIPAIFLLERDGGAGTMKSDDRTFPLLER